MKAPHPPPNFRDTVRALIYPDAQKASWGEEGRSELRKTELPDAEFSESMESSHMREFNPKRAEYSV